PDVVEVPPPLPPPQPFPDSLQLRLIFRINLRPKHLARRAPEKIPVAIAVMRHLQASRRKPVRNLRRQQKSMLVSNIVRRSLQVHVNPSSALKPITLTQDRIIAPALWHD